MRGSLLLHNLLGRPAQLERLSWEAFRQPGREGVDVFRLYDTTEIDETGPAAALVRYCPGARVQRHRHPGYELIFVLDGELINDRGRHGPGTLEICPPESTHALSSETGCVFLVVWEKPVQVVAATKASVRAPCDGAPAVLTDLWNSKWSS